jgi:hypothetical protein
MISNNKREIKKSLSTGYLKKLDFQTVQIKTKSSKNK